METTPAVVTSASEYLRWEEVLVSTDNGRREVHYILKRKDGNSDLAVVGKEKSSRHMSYRYANRSISRFGPGSASAFGRKKLGSRQDVVEWLNFIVKDSHTLLPDVVSSDGKRIHEVYVQTLKENDKHTKGFMWVGSPWNCEKRRRHYSSFIRNGVKISVYDFVYVLAEEGKRLVAYLKDLYQDSRGNKMVTVQWFHKIDEVDDGLLQSFNDREVFFSLCTQRLNIECIDGPATILAPQQFETYTNKTIHNESDPFLCRKQLNNGEVKPFDLTQIKGYWNQKIVKLMQTDSLKTYAKSQSFDGLNSREILDSVLRPKKKLRQSKGSDVNPKCPEDGELLSVSVLDAANFKPSPIYFNNQTGLSTHKRSCSAAALSRINEIKPTHSQYVAVGSQIEVLSQDSGVRGCWFIALIIKKYKEKVKVRYLDLKDAENEGNSVEEWILSSKVATPDQLGIRISERKIIRPFPRSVKSRVSWAVNIGSVVDAWWHDGWWEGLVTQKESNDKIHVYFPEEKQESVFRRDDLRHSHEWVENRWKHIKDRPELVAEITSKLEVDQLKHNSNNGIKVAQETISEICQATKSHTGYPDEMENEVKTAPDLSKDRLLSLLKWNSRKRRRSSRNRNTFYKTDCNNINGKRSLEAFESGAYEKFLIASSLKVDVENCKYIGDSPFTSSVVPLTSMVLSR